MNGLKSHLGEDAELSMDRLSAKQTTRRTLTGLNVARVIVVTTLLVVSAMIEVIFMPERSLGALYALSGASYVTVLLYALFDRWIGDRQAMAVLQVTGDALLLLVFVLVSGGSLSPLSFLLVIPVMLAAALMGLRGGVLSAVGVWGAYALILAYDSWNLGAQELPPGRVLYAALSHLLGFLTLGALGGVLADRLREADSELEARKEDLRALKALHADIVASIGTGLLTSDLEGRVSFVNRAGLEILCMDEQAARGRRVAGLFGLPEDFLQEASEQLRHGRRYRFERHWSPANSSVELFLGFSVSDLCGPDGTPQGWLIVFQDLSEIASLEEQVRTRERMAALGEMAAGMAHELRNPLAAICGSVQVLATPGADKDSANLRDVVLRESERLNRTIKDFLRFARPRSPSPRECDLGELSEQLARLLRKSPDMGRDHEVTVQSGPGLTRAVVDPDGFRQIFWNLATNAVKAMPDGGKLHVQVLGHGGDHVMVSFRDEGCGMDEEATRRYFQPFHGNFEKGTGLGAAIVYRIVEEHGGRVQIVSRPGRGTEIRLILPGARGGGVAGTVMNASDDQVVEVQ